MFALNVSEFGNERERGEKKRRFLKLRRRIQIEQQLEGYTEWICAAGKQVLDELCRTAT